MNPIANRYGFYTSYELTEPEFIGIAKSRHLRKKLERDGWTRPPTIAGIPLSAVKTHPDTGQPHNWTLRYPDPDRPRQQYHLHAFKTSQGTEVACHYELRPDLKMLEGESPQDRRDRLTTHYRPKWGEDYIRGKHPEAIQSYLSPRCSSCRSESEVI